MLLFQGLVYSGPEGLHMQIKNVAANQKLYIHGMAQNCHGNFNLLLMAILILPSTISSLPAAQISVLPTEIFTFPKCYSQIPLASSFSAQKFCKFTDMAAFAKSKVKITMSKIEN